MVCRPVPYVRILKDARSQKRIQVDLRSCVPCGSESPLFEKRSFFCMMFESQQRQSVINLVVTAIFGQACGA